MAAEPNTHVLVAEDDAQQREMLGLWLTSSGYRVTLAADGFEALTLVQTTRFDVLVTDLCMPGMDGLQLMTVLETMSPDTAVIFLSGRSTVTDAVAALRRNRAYDFLIKPLRDLRQLNLAIEGALSARAPQATLVRDALARPAAPAPLTHAAPAIPAYAPSGLPTLAPAPIPARMARTVTPPPSYVEPLTRTEKSVMGLLIHGHENREIANRLHYSEKTVRNYLSRIYEKLGVSNRLQAVNFCHAHGLLEPAEMAAVG